jgi:hypothetical protein
LTKWKIVRYLTDGFSIRADNAYMEEAGGWAAPDEQDGLQSLVFGW